MSNIQEIRSLKTDRAVMVVEGKLHLGSEQGGPPAGGGRKRRRQVITGKRMEAVIETGT